MNRMPEHPDDALLHDLLDDVSDEDIKASLGIDRPFPTRQQCELSALLSMLEVSN